MYCQVCGSLNPEEQEYCSRCHQRLLVLSGSVSEETQQADPESDEEGVSFDEHLLERISVLEEAVRRTAETTRQLLLALNKQERSILINQTGFATMRELLEGKRLVDGDEWTEKWEARMNYQLLALEKRERFVELKGRISALYHGDQRDQFVELLEDAEYALFAFDIERALEVLEDAFKLDRTNYELAYFIGETFFNDGQADVALPYFLALLDVKPEHYEGLVYCGVIFHERDERERAVDLLERALTLYPDSFLPTFSLGAIFAEQGELPRAVAYLEKATEIDAVPQALYLLGNCYFEMGKLNRAIQRLKRVVQLDPGYEEAYYLLGLVYLDRHWNRKALEAFRQAERLNPNRLRYQDLVRYLSGQTISPLPTVGPESADWVTRAEKYAERENLERAVHCYRRAVSLEPENPTLLMSYALICLRMNRMEETEVVTQKVLDLEPGDMLKATACATLIESLRSRGKFREGNRIGLEMLDDDSSRFARTIAYYEMAYNLAEMEEDLDLALDYAQRSLQLSPEELKQFPLAAMGWVHYKRHEFDEAISCLSRSSELEPAEKTLTHLGIALLAAGDEERARTILAEARDLGPQDGSLEQRMMECMKDSNRLFERVQRR